MLSIVEIGVILIIYTANLLALCRQIHYLHAMRGEEYIDRLQHCIHSDRIMDKQQFNYDSLAESSRESTNISSSH